MKSHLAAILVAVVVAACAPATTPSPSPTESGTASSPRPSTGAEPTPSLGPLTPDLAWYGLPQADDLLRGAAIASLAAGRSGFVVLGTDRESGGLLSWTSADGDGWVRHWLPGESFGGGSPDRVVGGDFGYLAVGWRLDGSTFSRALWASPDGVSWSPAPTDGLPPGDVAGLAAGPAGIVVLIERGERDTLIAASNDGRRWQLGEAPPGLTVHNPDDLAALPDGFLLVGSIDSLDASGVINSEHGAWRSADGLTWTADDRLATQLRDRDNSIEGWVLSPFGPVTWDITMSGLALLSNDGLEEVPAPPDAYGHLVGGPAGLLWVQGADRAGACSAAWQLIDDQWRALAGTGQGQACVDDAGPIVLGQAATPEAILILAIVGTEIDRVAWLVRSPGYAPSGIGVGGPVPTAPPEAIPDPLAVGIDRPAECPSIPTTIEALRELGPETAVACFGDRALEFRAWVVDPGEGYGGTCDAFTPSWMRDCVLPDYLLSTSAPGVSSEIVELLHAMRSPAATGDLVGVGRWVGVTGHYDDPISPSCRYAGYDGSIDLEPELPRAMAVLACRLQFVVTDLRTTR
jgi:hypothetical protein